MRNLKADAVFTLSREKASTDNFKASASEVLLIFPLLREFALQVVRPTRTLEKEVASLLALCGVLDRILEAKRVVLAKFEKRGV